MPTQIVISSVTDFPNYDFNHADIITVMENDRTSGNPFLWQVTANTNDGSANDGTSYAGASGFWNMMYEGAISVKWFDAKGDGSTDDTEAIENAIAAVVKVLPPPEDTTITTNNVYIPAGIYMTTGIHVKDNRVRIVGAGKGGYDRLPSEGGITILKAAEENNGYVLKAKALDNINPIIYFELENIMIDANGVAAIGFDCATVSSKISSVAVRGATETGVYVTGFTTVFEYMEIADNEDGIQFKGFSNASVFKNSDVYHNSGHGIIVNAASVFTIQTCTVQNNQKNGLYLEGERYGYLVGIGGMIVEGIYFENNGLSSASLYHHCKIQGHAHSSPAPDLYAEVTDTVFRSCLFASPELSNSSCVRIENEYVRNITFQNCSFLAWPWERNNNAFSMGDFIYTYDSMSGQFIIDIAKRLELNLKTQNSYVPAPCIKIDPYVPSSGPSISVPPEIIDAFSSEITGDSVTYAHPSNPIDGVNYYIQKRGQSVYLRLQGTTNTVSAGTINFASSGIIIRTDESLSLGWYAAHGYSIKTSTNADSIIVDIPNNTTFDDISFMFQSYYLRNSF